MPKCSTSAPTRRNLACRSGGTDIDAADDATVQASTTKARAGFVRTAMRKFVVSTIGGVLGVGLLVSLAAALGWTLIRLGLAPQ